MTKKYAYRLLAAMSVMISGGVAIAAHGQGAQPQFPVPGGGFVNAPQPQAPKLPTPPAITPNGTVVEDVVVRVNDQIITRSELERSEQQLVQDAQQTNASPADLAQRQRDLLRDMIDSQLLLSKGKELGVTGDAETVRQLDEIRKQNHLDSMEALEKAASQQGISYEDFKANIRNNIIRKQVVQDEVGRRLQMTRAQEQVYYDAHKAEFEQPESVHLSEILIPTPEGATDAVVDQAQEKANDVEAKLKGGQAFAAAAKQYSGGPSAAQGGELGDFKRGALAKVLEDATFSQNAGGVTAPIRTRQGFVILRTDSHIPPGVPPLASVEGQVQEAMYLDALQPALRAYLTKAREEAYIDIKPGFVDTGSSRKESKPVFTSYTPPPVKKKTEAKRRMEQQKDAVAQTRLQEARDAAAAKAAAKAAKSGGATNVAYKKPKKIKREKIRFGQAPRNALPTGLGTTATVGEDAPLAGQAPGVAMAGTDASTTSISTGTGSDNESDPLGPQPKPTKKTRYTARQADIELAKANDKALKAREHIQARPVSATAQEKADERAQAAPLGLNGDTKKKKPKAKRKKGEAKERLQEKPKVVDTAAPIAPTANPNLVGPVTTDRPVSETAKPSADRTTLPETNAAPGVPPQGQPLPATQPQPQTNPATTTPQ